MWIFLHKKDAKEILELGNRVGQLENRIEGLGSQWKTELVALEDIKEQVLNTIRRLQQRETRANRKATEEKSSEDAPGDAITSDLGVDPISEKIRLRREHRALQKRIAG